MDYKKLEIKKYSAIRQSIEGVPAGTTVQTTCVEFAPLQSVRDAVALLNKWAGRKEYECTTPDNGATIYITHR